MSYGFGLGHPGFPINTCTVLSMFLSQEVLLMEQGIYITVFIFYAAACCRNKLPQTQQLQTTQMHDFIEVWYRSHQSKIKVSAGLWSFPEAPEDVSLLIWIFGKIQFFGCYGTEVPFPCCLSAESCFYFHPLACGLFLHFQSQQQPYEAVRLTRGEIKGPRECQGSFGPCHQNPADPGTCSVLLELGWGNQKSTKN